MVLVFQVTDSVVEEQQLNFNLDVMLDLLEPYHADGTIVVAYSALEEFETYCVTWKLVVNENKTKAMRITGKDEPPKIFL